MFKFNIFQIGDIVLYDGYVCKVIGFNDMFTIKLISTNPNLKQQEGILNDISIDEIIQIPIDDNILKILGFEYTDIFDCWYFNDGNYLRCKYDLNKFFLNVKTKNNCCQRQKTFYLNDLQQSIRYCDCLFEMYNISDVLFEKLVICV